MIFYFSKKFQFLSENSQNLSIYLELFAILKKNEVNIKLNFYIIYQKI